MGARRCSYDKSCLSAVALPLVKASDARAAIKKMCDGHDMIGCGWCADGSCSDPLSEWRPRKLWLLPRQRRDPAADPAAAGTRTPAR
jgi:hypothetical protein